MSQRRMALIGAIMLLMVIAQYLDRRLIVSLTPSLPIAVYWRAEENPRLVRGAYYELSQPDLALPFLMKLGPMAPRAHLLKIASGLPGDRVCWFWQEMTVTRADGLANDARHTVQGVSYPRKPEYPPPLVGCRALETGEMVVTGTHPESCDSRYLGPIDTRRVLYRVVPILTWR